MIFNLFANCVNITDMNAFGKIVHWLGTKFNELKKKSKCVIFQMRCSTAVRRNSSYAQFLDTNICELFRYIFFIFIEIASLNVVTFSKQTLHYMRNFVQLMNSEPLLCNAIWENGTWHHLSRLFSNTLIYGGIFLPSLVR